MDQEALKSTKVRGSDHLNTMATTLSSNVEVMIECNYQVSGLHFPSSTISNLFTVKFDSISRFVYPMLLNPEL